MAELKENLKHNSGGFDKAADKTHGYVDEAAQFAHAKIDTMAKKADNLQETAVKYEKTALNFVKENPIAALTISAAVGAVLALILRR